MSLQTKKQVLGWGDPENVAWRAWRQPWNCYHRFDESGYFHFHPRPLQLWNHGIEFPARWRLCGFNLPIETKGWLMESNNPWIPAFSRFAALQEECPEVPDAGCPWQEYLLHEKRIVPRLPKLNEKHHWQPMRVQTDQDFCLYFCRRCSIITILPLNTKLTIITLHPTI